MKIHIVSDLHFEFGKWPRGVDVNSIEADLTVLAGDIDIGLAGIEWALTINRPVIYVMGNHEFYGQQPMAYLWRKAREKVAGTNVHLLENEEVVIEGIRFLGATLWTDFCITGAERQQFAMDFATNGITDYSCIFHGGDRFTPRKALSLHHESRDFLERRLAESFEGRTVVVTHHAPSALSLAREEIGTATAASYASALDSLVAKANLWVHGHTHNRTDYLCYGPGICPGPGRVVSNPRGYVGQEPVQAFDPCFVVEV